MRRQDLIGALSAGSAAVIIGSSVAASSLIAHDPPMGSQAARYALATGVLALLLWGRGHALPRLTRRDIGRVLALALTGLVGFNLCLLAALRAADPAAVGVVVGGMPVVLALAGPLLRRESPRSRVLGAAVTVSVGVAIVQGSGSGTTTALGLVLALGALAGEAAFSLLAAPLLPRLGSLVLSTYVCAMASVLLAGAAIAVDGTHALPSITLARAVAIGYLALPVTVGGFLLWFSGLARLQVERAGLFAGLIPLSALLSTAVVGMGAVTPLRVLGAGLVGVGVAIGVTGRAGEQPGREAARPEATAPANGPRRAQSLR